MPPANAVVAVSAGVGHTCALLGSGEIICWGDSEGDENPAMTDVPSGVYRAVSAGALHTCALRESGELACWGSGNDFGQLDAPPGRYSGLSAGRHHTCALNDSGGAVCWGRNGAGQADAPTGSFRSVSAGGEASCALDASGEVVCWGAAGTDAPNPDPQAEAELAGSYRAVSVGRSHPALTARKRPCGSPSRSPPPAQTTSPESRIAQAVPPRALTSREAIVGQGSGSPLPQQ